jgi:hypothetical protein
MRRSASRITSSGAGQRVLPAEIAGRTTALSRYPVVASAASYLMVLLVLAASLDLAAGLSRADIDEAGAYATIASPPAAVSGLPDGRVYEEVTPPDKNGNYVASGGLPATEDHGYSAAAANGAALVFLGSGAMGDAVASVLGPYVARRGSSGWSTSSALPPQLGVTIIGDPQILDPSADFSSFVFGTEQPYSTEQPSGPSRSVNLYRSENPSLAPVWLGKPTIEAPIPLPGHNTGEDNYIVAGESPTASTIYFSYSGTLVGQDDSRAPNVGEGTAGKPTDPWGFYEWTQATGLQTAGELPNGSVSAFGAVPAAVAGDGHNTAGWQAADFNNEISSTGTRAFFVSPDPVASTVTNEAACEAEGPCTTEPPELYLRETEPSGAKRTVLLSQSQLAGHVGEPATHGVLSVTDALIERGGTPDSADVYASPDGSRAFFVSTDRLTQEAPEDASPKEYDANTESGSLTYLPGVVGPIVASSRNGSTFIFENTAATPKELDLWRAGANSGEVTPIAQLPEPEDVGEPYDGSVGVEGRATADGSVFIFDTNAPIPGFSSNQEGYGEVYRYDVVANALTCVSCGPAGVAPVGNATMSYDNDGGGNAKPRSTVNTRAMSADGGRVFFDTVEPLVPQAVNGKRNVYEWEQAGVGSCREVQGCIYLLSSGTGDEDAFYLDNSESGDDVFFNTSAGLVSRDVDEAYDAYDAHVCSGSAPCPSSATQAAACEGETCQGPSLPPPVLAAPGSATLSGSGNLASPAFVTPRPLTRKQKLANALKACRAKHNKAKRRACERTARKRYGAPHKPTARKKSK